MCFTHVHISIIIKILILYKEYNAIIDYLFEIFLEFDIRSCVYKYINSSVLNSSDLCKLQPLYKLNIK